LRVVFSDPGAACAKRQITTMANVIAAVAKICLTLAGGPDANPVAASRAPR